MCRFLSWDFEYRLLCPVNKSMQDVRIQAYPGLCGHFLDVVNCSAASSMDKLTCGKACRDALENGKYWHQSGLWDAT